jgi:alpha-tubulin suppressor-like RCC1 family protein
MNMLFRTQRSVFHVFALLFSLVLPALATAQTPTTFGSNFFGLLGNGTTLDSNYPIVLSTPTSLVSVSARSGHVLALTSEGKVWAWGTNPYGELGDGTQTNRSIPILVQGITEVVQVSAGEGYSLALKADGTVWAWGWNKSGQLGDGTFVDRHTPTLVPGLTNVVQVLGCRECSYALKADGTVWAWGRNTSWGKFGNGTEDGISATPVPSSITDVVQIAIGYHHCVALKTDGTVWAWGNNNYGQFGKGTVGASTAPVFTNFQNAIRISAGGDSTFVLKADGSVWAAGDNQYGQIGKGNTSAKETVWSQVSGLTSVVELGSSHWTGYAIKAGGGLWCWGNNTGGQFGNGTRVNSSVPVRSLVQYATEVAGAFDVGITINSSPITTLTVPSNTQVYGATRLQAQATLALTKFPLLQRGVKFSLNGVGIGTARTAAYGIASASALIPAGKYTVTGYTPASACRNEAQGTGTLTVLKANTTLLAINITARYGETRSLKALYKRNSDKATPAGVKIEFAIDGTVVGSASTDSTGTALLPITFALGGLSLGEHTITARYAGDSNHNGSTSTSKLTVKKALTSLAVVNVAGKTGSTVTLKGVLVRSLGNVPVSGMTLQFYVGGTLVGSGVTSSMGLATLSYKITQKAGSYPLKVEYTGNTLYEAVTNEKATLSVN